METEKNHLDKKMKNDQDNATRPFSNAQKDSAVEINNSGDDDNSRSYKDEKDSGSQGPNFNKKSKNADGDTGQNAGIFK